MLENVLFLTAMSIVEGIIHKNRFIISDPPSITKTPSNGLYKAHKGDDVTLSCIGNGNPKPVITWTRLVSHIRNPNKEQLDGKCKKNTFFFDFSSNDIQHS